MIFELLQDLMINNPHLTELEKYDIVFDNPDNPGNLEKLDWPYFNLKDEATGLKRQIHFYEEINNLHSKAGDDNKINEETLLEVELSNTHTDICDNIDGMIQVILKSHIGELKAQYEGAIAANFPKASYQINLDLSTSNYTIECVDEIRRGIAAISSIDSSNLINYTHVEDFICNAPVDLKNLLFLNSSDESYFVYYFALE